jgi:hypothetical protein
MQKLSSFGAYRIVLFGQGLYMSASIDRSPNFSSFATGISEVFTASFLSISGTASIFWLFGGLDGQERMYFCLLFAAILDFRVY